jgi:hypothetical protein
MLTRFVAAACAVALLVSPCRAQTDKALSVIPDDALGFLMIKDLRSLSDKVNDTARRLNVQEKVSMLELIQKEMGIKEGINEKGSLLFLVLKGNEASLDGLRFLVALPVADHDKIAKQLAVKDIKDGIGQGELGFPSGLLAGVGGSGPQGNPKKFPILVARRGDFVLLATMEGRAGLESVLHAKKDITVTLKGTEDWLGRQDIAGFITNSGVQFGLGLFLGGPGGGTGATSPEQAAQLKASFADVEKNVRLITFGGRIEKGHDWRLSTAVHFQPEGSYARWIAQAQSLGSKLLANFPDEPHFAVLLARISAQTTFEGAARFVFGELPKDKVDVLQAEMAKLVGQVTEIGACAYVGKAGAAALPSKLAAGQSADCVILAKVRDANVFLDEAVDMLKHAHRAMHSAAKTKVEITYKEQDIAGKPSRLVTVMPDKNSAGKDDKDQPQVFLLTALDPQTVLGSALVDAGRAEAIIQKFSKPAGRSLESNAQVQQTQKLLPEKLQIEAFFDLQAFGILGKGAMQVSAVAPLGFSMRALPAAVEAQFVIPFDAIKAVFDASKELQKWRSEH